MIVMGGIEYMTTELISSKEAGKERIRNAIFGLLLALGAWTILNTINPNILKSDLSSLEAVTVDVPIAEFKITSSGPQSRYGTEIKIDFNTQAYPAAVTAQTKTGVDSALTLAIFAQETGGGANTGACFPSGANMTPADQTALASIVGSENVATTHVSCSLAQGHGGAIGLTQFMPTTWNQYKNKAAGYLGHQPDPWNTNDALMMTAVFLQANGGTTNPTQAAKAYFGSCNSSGIAYCDQIAAKTASIQKQIADAKTSGKIK
jgi:membrane-bound lytic murein transglycosylase B